LQAGNEGDLLPLVELVADLLRQHDGRDVRDEPGTDDLTHASLSPGGRADVLYVRVEIEAPDAALPTDPGLPGAAEGRGEVSDEEAVHPDGAGHHAARHALGAVLVAG